MAEKYVVFVSVPVGSEVEALGDKLAELLKLEPAQISGLLRRLPAVVTRPVSQREATAAAKRFQQAGFHAQVQTEEGVPVEFEEPPTPAEPFSSAAVPHTRRPAPADEVHEAPALTPPERAPLEPVKLEREHYVPPAAVPTPPPPPPSRGVEAAPAPAAVAPPKATATTPKKGRRGSLRSKLMSTAIIPVLLSTVGALAAIWFTARPALYSQLLESARNPAIATASTLSSALEREGTGEIDHLLLLDTILISRQAFERQNLSFILATDTEGNPYSASLLGGDSFPLSSLELQEVIRESALHAVQLGAAGRTAWADTGGASSNITATGGERIEVVAQPLMAGSEPIGAVVVGVTDETVTQQVNNIVINVLLFSLIPLLLAVLIAAVRARRLTGNVIQLTERADEISRGNLDEPVEFRSNDELDDLSAALERMRVSMSGALERLRRRR